MLGVLNVTVCDPTMNEFCESWGYKNLFTDPTCFKDLGNSTCREVTIDQHNFQNSSFIESGLSGSHCFESNFQKLKSKIVRCWDYKSFSNDHF